MFYGWYKRCLRRSSVGWYQVSYTVARYIKGVNHRQIIQDRSMLLWCRPTVYAKKNTLCICWVYKWKWNESGFRPLLAKLGQENLLKMVRWVRWHCPPATGFEIQTLEVWGRARSRWGRNIFVSFKPPRPGTELRTLAWKAAVLTTTLGPPPVGFITVR